MSVPGRLADVLDQSLQDTGQVLSNCHTITLLILEKKSDLIPMQKVLFLGYRFDLVSLHVTPTLDRHRKIQAIIQSLLNRLGWGHARMWQILLGLFAATDKLVPLVCLHTCEDQHCMSQHWDFNPSTSDTWIPISSAADEGLQWWMSRHNVRMGAREIPKDPDAHLFMDASNTGWGAHWNSSVAHGPCLLHWTPPR